MIHKTNGFTVFEALLNRFQKNLLGWTIIDNQVVEKTVEQ